VVTIVKKSGVRNLTKTLAVVSLLAPASGHTLGIGEIKLHSALNQNLDAEIALTLSGENVSDIKVNLAPPEKFDEAGVSWNYFLSKIKLETVTHSNGTAVIKLTSKEALKEPFLDFLLEVSWPKGNLYREFTVLVDPPSVYNQATIPVSTIPVSTSTENYAKPPVTMPQRQSHANGQSSESEYGPTLGNDTLWSVADRARGQSDVSVEQMVIAIYEANPQAFYKGNVYALMSGKMLKIPEREAILKLSRNQALAEFNRHTKAWKNHSAPAHVETAKEKPALSRAEGPGDNQLTLVAPTKAAVADHAVVASVNEQARAEKKAAEASAIVKGKAEEGASDAATQSKVAELEKQLAMMQEMIALKDQQLAALQNKFQEHPVGQEQAAPAEVVAAKPADQVTPAPQPVEPAPGEVVAAKPVDQVTPAPQPVEPVPGEVIAAKPVNQAPPAPQQAVVQPVQPAAQPKPEGGLFDPSYLRIGGAGLAISALLGWLWWRKRKVDEETNTESMFATSSMIKIPEADESLSVPVVEEGAVHDVGTVGESSFLSEFTPSDFDSFDTDQGEIDPISEADVYLAYGRYQQAEELIRQAIKDQPNRDECKLKLLEIFYANESKTAFEAYANELVEAGKRSEVEFWEKAAEMGREICPDSPLFSSGEALFAVADNTSVENSDENIGGRADVMTGTASFGELDSEDFAKETTALKGDEPDTDLTSPEADSFVDEQRNNEDIDFDLSSFSMDTKESDEAEKGVIASSTLADKSSGAQIEDIDFDLSSFSMDTNESDEAEKGVIASSTLADKSSGAQIEDIDFDLSSFSMDTNESDEAEKDVIAPSTFLGKPSGAQIEDIDFDLGSFSMDSKESDEAEKDVAAPGALSDIPSGTQPANQQQEFESYEFSFSSDNAKTKEIDSLDFSALENSDKKQQDVDFSADKALDFNDDFGDDFDFNFDLDEPLTTSGQSNQYDEFGVSDLTDMDELETKLDLAKAYVDMGDAEAAKDIAKEVLEQGTAEQKKAAKALLDELD